MNSKRPPILLSGLILGLFGLANLLLNYHSIFFYFLNGLALILWIYLTLALVLSFADYRQDLQKPPLLSSFATYPMASMLLAAYLNKLGLLWMSQLLWYLALLLHIVLIAIFTWKYVLKAEGLSLTPSWTVLYVGLAMASLTQGVVHQPFLGYLAWFFALLLSLILYPLFYKARRAQRLPDTLKPQWAIYCAPFSLLLGSYIRLAGSDAEGWFVALLLLLSQAFYLLVLCLLPRIFRLGPQLSWSALTFPLVNTAFALKLGLDYLGWTWLVWLSHAEALLAFVIVLYVCFYYTVSLRARKITKNPR
ncbi:TDT family transporter [Streptococcus sanguinis]|uniref:C4-dicarboxylate transporter/malic acid transporter n=1 Tax=Streptococcus sanguinis SK160 TaxID=888812 RepID=F0ITF1_STRSA|nr:TDT family transporter [Streptococcus sanguinis]EGD38775.1 C4-dicarboxylate transporter/malic acid transporter [Streptococcus sanguinis SK160]MBZ2025779.1 TDT family transporter [Streptococcus sanguinis]RSH99301.1 C4-dicarboxylate transporter/malic acid transport protein [Streptococcus sanguinis]RSI03713.1 C4-dicarboxylate transporter/malic acid transport protein [Streptococcus sanguinis]RSI39719.1 C4-dicarboxylate transporter/malic acid transport protein [Streptococcus sanguinis]